MKRSLSMVLSLTAICGVALSSYGVVIVNDTWADSERGSTGPDGGGIDSAWWGSTGAALTVPAAGTMRAAVPATSLSETTYFPLQTLATVGDQLRITWIFTPTTLTANTSQAFNLAVVNGATHISSDVSPGSQVYAGYAMFMNMSNPNLGNSNPFALREWIVGSGALLSSSGNWGANGAVGTLANGATTPNHGYDSGTQYTFVMTLTLNASSGLDITSTMTGGTLDGDGSATISFTDASPNALTFDTFALRQTGSPSGAAQVDITQFKVEFLQVPEPSTLVLAGLGLLGFAGYRRMRR